MAWKSRRTSVSKTRARKAYRWPTRKRGGEVAEAAFLAKAASLGFSVAKTWGDSDLFDFILDSGSRTWRVQIKSACHRQRSHYVVRAGNGRQNYTKGDIDFLVVYIVPADAWYVIPVEATGGRSSLWFSPDSSSQGLFEPFREAWCLMACKRHGFCRPEIAIPPLCGTSRRCPVTPYAASKRAAGRGNPPVPSRFLQTTKYLVDNPPRLASNEVGTEDGLPPRVSPNLTEAELRLMDVLWLQGPSSVQQVLDKLPKRPPLAYNSVLTTIRILEKKGYVRHQKDGRAHIYTPVIERDEATRSEISHLVQRFFKNSRELLVLNILEEQKIDAAELKRLRQLLGQEEESSQ